MSLLRQLSPTVQVYSIDEAFFEAVDVESLKYLVQKQTGIPVSIGVARTKTLAKVANNLAKKGTGIHYLQDDDLEDFPVEKIWGVGYRSALKLQGLKIFTAKDLLEADRVLLRKKLSVVGVRIADELSGIQCFPLQEGIDPKQSIACSRMFGRPVKEKSALLEAVATYVARAAEKLRKSGLLASMLYVYIEHHPRDRGGKALRIILRQPTDYTPELIESAGRAIHALFREGRVYRKVGIVMEGLVPKNAFQKDLFGASESLLAKRNDAMCVLDSINKKFGKEALIFAAEGFDKKWAMRQEARTSRFTTRWEEILKIKV
jgi:DNA polymerase V